MVKRLGRFTFLVEALVLLLALVAFNAFVLPERPGFLDAAPHPYVIICLLSAARYGFFPGVLVSLIFTATYFAQLALAVDVASWQDFLATRYSQPAVFSVAGSALLGLVADQHLRRLQRAVDRLNTVEGLASSLQASQSELRDVNAELASRIVGAESTLPVLYKYARLLNAADEDAIYRGLVEVAKDALQAELVSLYIPRGAQLIRRYGDGPETFPLDQRIAGRLLRTGGVLTLRDLPQPGPEGPPIYLAGALRQGEAGPICGVLTIDRLDFRRYTEANIGLFDMLIEWGAVSLGQALDFSRLSESERAAASKQAETRSKRSADVFARTGFIRLADVGRSQASVTDPDADATNEDIFARIGPGAGVGPSMGPGAGSAQSTSPPRRRFDQIAEPAMTQMLSGEDLVSLDASGGDLGVAIAAEVGRAGLGGARFATLLTRLGDHLQQVKGGGRG